MRRLLLIPRFTIVLVFFVTYFPADAQEAPREWTSVDGTSVVATIVGTSSGKVHLKLEDGRIAKLQYSKLCAADRKYSRAYLDRVRRNTKKAEAERDHERERQAALDRQRQAEQREREQAAAEQLKREKAAKRPPFIGDPPFRRLGKTGHLGPWEISQVMDSQNMLVYRTNDTLWVNTDTSGLVDGQKWNGNGEWRLEEVERYKTVGGATKSVFVARRLNEVEAAKALAERKASQEKRGGPSTIG